MTSASRRIMTGIVLSVGLLGVIYGITQLFRPVLLVGTTWELQHYGDPQHPQPAVTRAGHRPTLAFGPATLSGWAGCNTFSDGYFIAVGSYLKLSRGGVTLAACVSATDETTAGAIMWQERVYLDLLSEVRTFTRDGDTLTLHTPDAILIFTRSH